MLKHGIPHILHQTWKTHQIPSRFEPYVQSWKQYHPTWKYILWSDRDLRNLIQTHYAWFLPVYDSYPTQIQRVDVARYFILDHMGGVYVDLDFECRRALDPLVDMYDCVLGQEPIVHAQFVYKRPQVLCNALMASIPKHPAWDLLQRALVKQYNDHLDNQKKVSATDVLNTTGPGFLDTVLRPHVQDWNIYIAEPNMFYPKLDPRYHMYQHKVLLNEVWAIHHWAHTWT
jgi:mannosyltransferase OCH1-like enzyme